MQKYVVAALFAALLSACAPTGGSGESLAEKTDASVGCSSFQQNFWDEMDQIAVDRKEYPTTDQMRAKFDQSLAQGRLAQVSPADRARVVSALTDLYSLLTRDPKQRDEMLSFLASAEIGDRTSDEKSKLQDEVQAKFKAIDETVASLALPACATTPPEDHVTKKPSTQGGTVPKSPKKPKAPTTLFEQWKATRTPAIFGALKTLATAYQSCDVGTFAPLDKSTPDVQGIKVVGTASDGIGSLREISDLPSLLKTHPYLTSWHAQSAACVDVTKNPLIYDYGGRPEVTSGNAFDFFTDNGGTKVLGTDCSGYVYMALSTAGLRIKSGTKIKASTIMGITSHWFVDPQANGMTCLDFAKFKGADTMRPGDILAKPGHVFLIESVGADPFGIAGIAKVEDCTAANMSIDRFDFTILQSSPSKNGIGIHRVVAKDYIPESPQMMAGLLDHAVNACKAKFAPTTATVSKSTNASLVRHSLTSACKESTPIAMTHESCVSTCPTVP